MQAPAKTVSVPVRQTGDPGTFHFLLDVLSGHCSSSSQVAAQEVVAPDDEHDDHARPSRPRAAAFYQLKRTGKHWHQAEVVLVC